MCPPRVPEPRPRIGRSPRRNSARTQPESGTSRDPQADRLSAPTRPAGHIVTAAGNGSSARLPRKQTAAELVPAQPEGQLEARSDLVDRRAKADGGLQIPPRTDSALYG